MLCGWAQADADHYKCRACVCGNFAEVDPTQQSWTAQAEPSSLLASLKLGRNRGWLASKHDVKGAFMHAKIPEGRTVIVCPPEMWVQWGLVAPGTYWTLDKAVYGLRESPCLWEGERDSKLEKLTWMVGKTKFCLKRCSADSQVWILKEDRPDRNALLGFLIVYVDDFLLQVSAGAMRDAFLASLASVWTLAKEEDLTVANPIIFLGIEIVLRPNGDVFLHQRRFLESLLTKHNMTKCKGNTCVQVDKPPEVLDLPTPAQLIKHMNSPVVGSALQLPSSVALTVSPSLWQGSLSAAPLQATNDGAGQTPAALQP